MSTIKKQINALLQKEASNGPLILYQWKGKTCIRSKGNTGRQAPIAKVQAARLGKASAISAGLRTAFKPFTPGKTDRPMMYRLNNAILQWLKTGYAEKQEIARTVTNLEGFPLSGTGELVKMLQVSMPVSQHPGGGLMLQLPVFDSPNPISPLPYNGEIKIKLITASINVEDPAHKEVAAFDVDIDYHGEPIAARQIKLDVDTHPGFLTVTSLCINDSLAGIVHACYN